MAKVHPNAVVPDPTGGAADELHRHHHQEEAEPEPEPAVVLTVWRKSLLFNCDGFTVFDANGDLAFRVDCYATSRRRAEVLLMDVAGNPLLTVRRRSGLLGLLPADRWAICRGDTHAEILSVRRHHHRGLRRASKALAHVTPHAAAAGTGAYVVEGSYGRRACAVRDARGDAVAEVRRKESVGDDVFRLVADPRLGAPLAMGLVIALDEMFAGGGSARSLLPRTWFA